MKTSQRRFQRGGFTLIEMLVTFSIIAVLAAMIAAGMMTWISSQARRNTEAEIRTVHSALMQHWEAVANDAQNEKNIPTAVLTFAENDPARARVIWVKLRLMEAFPVRFAEINGNYAAPLNMIPADRRRYQASFRQQIQGKTGTQSKTESAACLLMALNVNHFGVSNPADLFRPFTRDVDNDGLLEFSDGWNEPLYFYRFGTGNNDLQASAPPNARASTNLDPRDPMGKLLNWANGTTFDSQIHNRQKSSGEAWYAVPALVSAGPDSSKGTPPGSPGLGVTYSASAPYQDLTQTDPVLVIDDLCSYKLK